MSNEKNYIECLEIAAAKLGRPELAIDVKFALEDRHYELMQTAAELYCYLSNLHKHGVMPSLPRFADLIYEEDLPDIMTKEQYSEWYDKSCLVDGVRMGPPYTPPIGNGA